MNQAKLLQIQIIEYQGYSVILCLDTLDLRQSTFAQWRFEQCHISCFVDTKLLDTIHLEHDNMVQRSIGATILRSENYMARRSTSTNTLNCSFTLLAASACKDLRLSGTRHIFSYLMRCDKLWWVLRRCVYVWLPLTTHIYIRMCRFSGTSPICRRSRMLLYTQKSEQGSSGGSNFLHLSCCSSTYCSCRNRLKYMSSPVAQKDTNGTYSTQLAWTNWPPTSMKSVKMLEFQQGLE